MPVDAWDSFAERYAAQMGLLHPPSPERVVVLKRQEGYPPFYPYPPPQEIEMYPDEHIPSSSLDRPMGEGALWASRPPEATPDRWMRWFSNALFVALLVALYGGIFYLIVHPHYWR